MAQTVLVVGQDLCNKARKLSLLLIVTLLAALLPFSGGGGASAATMVVVSPANMDGWAIQDTTCGATNTGTIDFVNGPATPPRGVGSARFTIGSDGDTFETLRNSNYNGVRLDAISSLTYSTYVSAWTGAQVPYLNLLIDTDANGTIDDQLFFEPAYQQAGYGVPNQGPPALNTWQTWDARSGGWWSLNAGTFGPPLVTLAQYQQANPLARIVNTASGAGGVRIATGCGGAAWVNFVGNADNFTIGVNGIETTYDFDPVADLAIAKSASPNPVNAGSNVTYTLTVVNNGAGAPATTTVTDALPAGTTFASCAASNGGVCGGTGNNRTITFSALGSGATATVILVATVDPSVPNGTVLSNTATISSASPDPNTSNNSATATVTVASTPPPAAAPIASLSTTALDFGTQQVGTSSGPQTVTVTNTGTATLSISTVSTTGANPGDFILSANTCTGANLAPGATCTVNVSFTPTAANARSANLTFVDNASNSPQNVALTGTGTTPPSTPIMSGWTGWTSLGGILTDSPAAAGFNGRVYVFAKGSDNALYVKSSADGINWTDWSYQGGILTDAPAATSLNGVLYVFAKGSDNALYVKTSTNGTTFSDWRRLGGVLTAPPAATAFNGRLYIFARGTNVGSAQSPVYPLWMMSSADGVNYSVWQNLGGNLTAAPAATSFQGRLYIFARGIQAGNVPNPVFPGQPNPPIYPLYAKSSANGTEFGAWQNLGGNLTAAPAATSYTDPNGAETLYVFANGTDNALYERHSTDGLTYTGWVSLGGELVGPPAAASTGNRVYVFVRWSNDALYERHTTP